MEGGDAEAKTHQLPQLHDLLLGSGALGGRGLQAGRGCTARAAWPAQEPPSVGPDKRKLADLEWRGGGGSMAHGMGGARFPSGPGSLEFRSTSLTELQTLQSASPPGVVP